MKLDSLMLAMRLLRKQREQIRASQIELLLAVAEEPGLTMAELASRCDLSKSTITKAIDVLGIDGRRDGKGGKPSGLVETRGSDCDDRKRCVFLTQKGQALLFQLHSL